MQEPFTSRSTSFASSGSIIVETQRAELLNKVLEYDLSEFQLEMSHDLWEGLRRSVRKVSFE